MLVLAVFVRLMALLVIALAMAGCGLLALVHWLARCAERAL